jgi:Zn-dependent protease with chaperone function
MNFFAAQDEARRASRRLVFAYIIATLVIVVAVTGLLTFVTYAFSDVSYRYTFGNYLGGNPTFPVAVALGTALLIVLTSASKAMALSSGGGQVARQLGGTLVSAEVRDPLRRRLRNVVEEMAIASGVPVPEIYVLEQESGINAFAAGYTQSDAAVAVTRGALELLSRDELQGVIGHEFSHILNGDMRLNIRLMGILFGIMALAIIGRFILRGARHVDDGRAAVIALALGFGLLTLGGIGMIQARIIKAGVSRQREYLADASAVQFTRQTNGIAGALKKIGGYNKSSHITAADPEEVSHMLFGTGARLSGLFATHPPLHERIQALDPSFRAGDMQQIDAHEVAQSIREEASAVSNLAPSPVPLTPPNLPDAMVESVGKPEAQHVEYAQHVRGTIPAGLYDAAHSTDLVYLLSVALVIDPTGGSSDRQLSLIREQLGVQRANIVRRLFDELSAAGAEYRLPILGVSFPALKQRPAEELDFLIELVTRLIEVDGKIDLYEFCFYRILVSNLRRAANPAAKDQRAKRSELQAAAIDFLSVLADYGHDNDDDRSAAFESGIATLGPWAREYAWESSGDYTVSVLDHSLDVLLRLNTRGKESLLRAIGATAAHDKKVTMAEAGLIRAVCASLDFPLPPILTDK